MYGNILWLALNFLEENLSKIVINDHNWLFINVYLFSLLTFKDSMDSSSKMGLSLVMVVRTERFYDHPNL